MADQVKLRRAFDEGYHLGAARVREPDYYMYVSREDQFNDFVAKENLIPPIEPNIEFTPIQLDEKVVDIIVAPCKYDSPERDHVVRCEGEYENHIPEFWGLYVQYISGLTYNFADAQTEHEAWALRNFLINLIRKSKQS